MANLDNLKPFNTMTDERQKEIAKQGGIASGKARLRKKVLKMRLELAQEEQREQEQHTETMRKAFRKNDLTTFKNKAVEYLELDQEKKTVNGLCEYLGITRYTLSKYRKRGKDWQQIIDQVKQYIYAFNCDKKAAKEYEKLIGYAKKFKEQGLSLYS